ncbi:MAG: CoB--CoM heterodisulfide reductase iron-sulfur subunit A family protein [Candidatus Syntrophoarchaeum sp.]|nr:CoB--CoM heterodisulfide reductase iron-sulfur subunit A family protein [Candidatus Syntrophoarchaeum sp.]
MKIGVYICHCGTNVAATVDVKEVVKFAKNLPDVAISRDYVYMCSDPGQETIKKDILDARLDRVVVASCSPRMHEPTFRKTCEEAGLNAYCMEMANIREQCSWVHLDREKATEKAKELVASAVAKASLLEALEPMHVGVTPSALVIGGGIAGIQSAMDIADAGFQVYLVEREPSIGGHMAQLDKTFPTLDCSACVLTPKMVDVARHKNIELITYAGVETVDGYIGNFRVVVRKKARYVDEEKCTGCGDCAKVCPVIISNEFDMDIGARKSAYVPFPQAVPLVYTLERAKCMKCGLCEVVCEPGAINFEDKDEEIELEVGAIVVATGYDLFDASLEPNYGYEYDEVITGLEFERLCNASGPTFGKIEINGKEPKEVVFISCVGSREKEVEGGKGNEYCSRVCCMYIAKQAHLVTEHIPDANVTVFYTDVRAFGKGFEEFYWRVKEEGVNYIRRELADEIKVEKEANGKLKVKTISEGHIVEKEADLVVLATGFVPRKDVLDMVRKLKIMQSGDKFFLEAHPKLRPMDTLTDGIFIAGCCQAPKDIPDSVAQASAAASRVCSILSRDFIEVEPIIAEVNEAVCIGCGSCEEVCPFGAIELREETMEFEELVLRTRKSNVNPALCKGCGACIPECPVGAMTQKQFTSAQIEAMLRKVGVTA